MIKTGYISFMVESGGGFDNDGNVIAPSTTPSDYMECNLKTITRELQFVVDGQYVKAKHSVYVDQDKFNTLGIDLETINQVIIQSNNSNDRGTYQIHNREYLNLTKRIKIIV